MAGLSIFDIAGRAMSAQLVRLNTTASNLANAGQVATRAEDAYRARKPIFAAVLDRASDARATVRVDDVVAASAPPMRRYEPGHPLANKDGYVFEAAVDPNQELIEMVETARQYQNDVEVLNTAKSLILGTLKLGQ
jgi:flagellar basal-body rod protein FlgC